MIIVAVQITAVVVEQGTATEMNSTWSTLIEENSRQIVLDIATFSSKSFKSNLPYYGNVRVTTAGGAAAPAVSVEVCVHPTFDTRRPTPVDAEKVEWTSTVPDTTDRNVKYCALRVSDARGFVAFEFLPNLPDLSKFNIKVPCCFFSSEVFI